MILTMKIYNFLGYGSYTGYVDLKTNFKYQSLEHFKFSWLQQLHRLHRFKNQILKICLLKKLNYEFDLILAMKIYSFLEYGSYTGYTDLKVNFKDPLVEKIKL